MQPLFNWSHRPKQHLHLHVGTQEELRQCVDFALQHTFLPQFWNDRSILQFHVTKQRPHANFLLYCWTFPEMGSLLNHLRKKHEPDADTCQQEPRNTIAGCWKSQICKGKQCESIQLCWQQCSRNFLSAVVLLRSGGYLTRPCLWNCSGQENVGWQ